MWGTISNQVINNHAAFIWSVADLLGGDYKQSEYGKVILPLTVLRRLDCVLEPTKADVLERYDKLQRKLDNLDPVLEPVAGAQFYNTSKLDLPTLLDDPSNIADNLRAYIAGFSSTARDVLDKFDFDVLIARLDSEALRILAEPDDDGDADGLRPNGVPVDLLVAVPDSLRSGVGRGGQAKRREATGHALRWAVDTAISRELACEPENPRGPVVVPVASVSALLAMKTIALTDLTRGEKVATDRLDLWLLLTDDVDRAVAALQQLSDAPPAARRWASEVLVRLLRDDPEDLVRQTATGHRAPRSVDDVEDVWQSVVEPHLEPLRR